jgi:hypothetical protein
MALWEFALWSGAAVLAFITLMGLMTRHRQQSLQELAAADQARRQAEAKAKQPTTDTSQKRGTAA